MNAKPLIVDAAGFDVAIAGARSVVAKFTTETCVICRRLDPMLSAVAEHHDGMLAVIEVDAEQSPMVAERYAIRGVPTLILFQNGEEVDRRAGFQTAKMLRDWIEPHLGI